MSLCPHPARWAARGFVVALFTLLAPAHAGDKPAPQQDKPKLVCFSDPSTGSHIRKRICMSEEAAEARRKRDQEAMASMRQKTAPQPSAPTN